MAISDPMYNNTTISNQKYHVRENYVYECIIVHRCEFDIDLIDAYQGIDDSLREWKKTEQGKWCLENCADLDVMREADPVTQMYRIAVKGLLTPDKATYYRLKWGSA